jgi:hypothetical protein
MTMNDERYGENRVVTLLREIDPPMAPPDRLSEVTRRARRGESRRASAVAGLMAVVLATGVVSAVHLTGHGNTETLSVAGAAKATKATGSAVITMRFTVTHAIQPGLPDGDLFALKGPADFKHERFAFKGAFGGQPVEMRGIGKDRWTKQAFVSPVAGTESKSWIHSVDTAPVTGLSAVGDADPGELLDALTSKGTVISTRTVGDRTRTVLRLPAEVLGSGFGNDGSEMVEATVESDAEGRIRLLTSETSDPSLGTLRATMRFDDFGIDVDVQPPPADQVREASAVGSGSTSEHFSVTTSGSGSTSTMSPEDRKRACEAFKAAQAQQPTPKTDAEKARQKQLDDVVAQACKG